MPATKENHSLLRRKKHMRADSMMHRDRQPSASITKTLDVNRVDEHAVSTEKNADPIGGTKAKFAGTLRVLSRLFLVRNPSLSGCLNEYSSAG